MERITSGDAEICYEVLGSGPPVVLLHPFPANHEFWRPVSQALVSRYRLILPDLRGHGESGVGEGPARIEKHAEDIARILDHADAGRVPLVGASIGGYIFFEFWRRYRGRVAAAVLCNTKAPADTPEGKASRLQAANDVLDSVMYLKSPVGRVPTPSLISVPAMALKPEVVVRVSLSTFGSSDWAQENNGTRRRISSRFICSPINWLYRFKIKFLIV